MVDWRQGYSEFNDKRMWPTPPLRTATLEEQQDVNDFAIGGGHYCRACAHGVRIIFPCRRAGAGENHHRGFRLSIPWRLHATGDQDAEARHRAWIGYRVRRASAGRLHDSVQLG